MDEQKQRAWNAWNVRYSAGIDSEAARWQIFLDAYDAGRESMVDRTAERARDRGMVDWLSSLPEKG